MKKANVSWPDTLIPTDHCALTISPTLAFKARHPKIPMAFGLSHGFNELHFPLLYLNRKGMPSCKEQRESVCLILHSERHGFPESIERSFLHAIPNSFG